MNAYQITPFNAGSSTSPFNYFPQNSHSYGVISPSYGSPRSSGMGHTHKNMSSQAPFVASPNYFQHQSALQPFTSFTNPVQSANAPSSYSHSYGSYAGTSSPSMTNATSQSSFDYSHGYNSSSATTYSYLGSCSNQYSAYPAGVANSTTNVSTSNTLSYPSQNQSEPYINVCSNRADSQEDPYAIPLHKNEGQLQPAKKVKKSGRGRNRRNMNPSPLPENSIDRIFVWYLDETVLSYLTMAEYSRFAGFSDTLSPALCNEIFMFINKFAEKYLFLSDLKDIDQSHIDDSATDDNGQDLSNYNFSTDGFKTSCNMGSSLNSNELRQKMALRYRKINEIYCSYNDKLDELLDKSDHEQLQELITRFDLFSKNWIPSAVKALSFIKSRPNCLNILVSTSPLIYTLSKVLVFGLGPYFSIGNIYSCSKTSKEHTLNRVLNRFGSNCTYIVVGKGPEEQQLSQKLELPFWPVTEKDHFESLVNAMHYFF